MLTPTQKLQQLLKKAVLQQLLEDARLLQLPEVARLQQLLENLISSPDFKQSAMTLVREGADITVQAHSGARPTLLHILARTNNNGLNNDDMDELVRRDPNILECKDNLGQTALQSLMNALYLQQCTFNHFKQSAMVLARLGADTTLQSSFGKRPLLHLLALENKNGSNDASMSELIQFNPNVLTSTDHHRATS